MPFPWDTILNFTPADELHKPALLFFLLFEQVKNFYWIAKVFISKERVLNMYEQSKILSMFTYLHTFHICHVNREDSLKN